MNRARPLVLAALTLVLAAAACSSGGGSNNSTTPPVSPSVTTSVPPTTAAPSPTVSLAPSTSAAASSATPTRSATQSVTPTTTSGTAAPPVLRSTCTSVMVRIIRGSAAAGREFAALQFTNTGAATCVLNGYPSVTLLLGGKAIGTSSTPSKRTASTRTLAPGDTAESKLNDYTDCQAPLSDTIRVRVPGSTITSQRSGQLRACTLRVDPLAEPE